MEAVEETLAYLDDTGLHRKLLPGDKVKKDNAETRQSHESNYVDLDMKPDGPKTVRVTFTGEGNQLSVITCDGMRQGTPDHRGPEVPPEPLTTDQDSESEPQPGDGGDPAVPSGSDELRYTDMYLNSKTESDDGTSAVMSDHCGSDTVPDESHYITTHEIQLTELDHDVDYDLGRGTCWDLEDDNLVYSFVDYASFESDDTPEGTLILEGRSQAKAQSNLGEGVVNTEQEDEEESDLCDSDDSGCKDQRGDAKAGKIHVSIQTSSCSAADEPAGVPGRQPFGDRGHFSLVGSGARAGPLCDRAPYFIPAPGRQHLATKLRRKDINEYSSGASSSISELDDADKEVRNLTAKSFRSLACPYFDAINLSTSSESSMSEYGLNKWSAYMDWNYGNLSRGKERSVIAQKTSRATLEMNKTVDGKRHGKSSNETRAPHSKTSSLNKRETQGSGKKLEVKDPVRPKQRGVTLNFRCNVEDAPEGTMRVKCSKSSRSTEMSGAVSARSGCDMQYRLSEGTEGTHKRAIFASSLLKNVISKKMQFEQERQMERGEIRNRHSALSPDRSLDSGSGLSVYSTDEPRLEGNRPPSFGPAEEHKGTKAPDEVPNEHSNAPLIHSQTSAFNSMRADESGAAHKAEPPAVSDAHSTRKEEIDTNSVMTKLLFVPSCQLLPQEKDFTKDLSHTPARDTMAGPQKYEKEFKASNGAQIIGKDEREKAGITPEIKICLRSVKENKGCTLNMANLLTPQISCSTGNASADAKCQVLCATDKIPHFTVRDIRDTKCKFHMPIYRVRDVRKLVKSSYRFVSLDNSDRKCPTAADKLEERGKSEPDTHLLPSPIVIKCHSVKTNVKSEASEASQKQAEAAVPCATSQSESAPSHCTSGRAQPVVPKQPHGDQSEIQPTAEGRQAKQRQDRFPGETAERRNDPAIPQQAAIDKLKAAVKTMEQLYVFDRNEWKRRSQPPQPTAESHLRSLTGRVPQPETANADGSPLALINTSPTGKAQGPRHGAVNVIHVPYPDDALKAHSQQNKTFSNRSVLHFGHSNKVSVNSVSNSAPQSAALHAAAATKSARAPPKHAKLSPAHPAVSQGCSDYLTIPGLGYASEIKVLNQEPPVSREGNSKVSQSVQKGSALIMEYPSTSIYHHSAAPGPVMCISPPDPSVTPPTSNRETVPPQTQRKMLLDPTTGHYYLVDTPMQATTKRLFDPETGQYVDVPMPLSPLTLSPGAFAPTYVLHPGFLPSPTLPARSPCHSEDGDKGKHAEYYSATAEAPRGPPQLPVGAGHARGGGAGPERKPLISITTQQGPRIIAPPSFDGTTMSFVVEHR